VCARHSARTSTETAVAAHHDFYRIVTLGIDDGVDLVLHEGESTLTAGPSVGFLSRTSARMTVVLKSLDTIAFM